MAEPVSSRPLTGTGTPHIALLTILRGLAAWWIVLYHFNVYLPPVLVPTLRPAAGLGYLAVDLFFVMSGYVIALNYQAWFVALNRRSYGKFLLLRLARIYPLHVATLLACLVNPAVTLLFSHLGVVSDRYAPLPFLYNLFLVQNWDTTRVLTWNIPAWSISAECAAYLLFPAIILAARRCAADWRMHLLGFAVLLGCIVQLGRLGGNLGGDITELGTLRCLVEFSLGVLVYFASLGCCLTQSRAWLLLLLGFAILVGAARQHWPDYAYAPFAFAVILLGAIYARLPEQAGWVGRWLIVIGELSYSTYLVHYIVRDWVLFLTPASELNTPTLFVIYVSLTILASVTTFFLVERPAQIYFRRRINAVFAP